jgi:cephalosporin hydroxylase
MTVSPRTMSEAGSEYGGSKVFVQASSCEAMPTHCLLQHATRLEQASRSAWQQRAHPRLHTGAPMSPVQTGSRGSRHFVAPKTRLGAMFPGVS